MTKLIGITGLAGSGKDTLADAFVRLGFTRMAFADALKHATSYIAAEAPGLYFDPETKEQFSEALGMTRRKALQEMGNGVRETLGPLTWINRVLRVWEAGGRQPTVISDCRYENEAERIKDLGGIVLRVVRPGNSLLAGAEAVHISELGVSDSLVMMDIINAGTIGDLNAEARKIALALQGQAG
jgi:hypothetical protein